MYVDNFKIVIIGNKIDLDKNRSVKLRDGEYLAKENDALYFEISTKECINVFQTIEEIIR